LSVAPDASATPQAEQNPAINSLDRVREEQDLLRSMIGTQYESKVESGSKYRLRLGGLALFNAFVNRHGAESIDAPQFATRNGERSFGATMRHSLITLNISGPDVAGAKTSGNLEFDFSGGFAAVENGSAFGLPRLRTGSIQLDWINTSLLIGQTNPFISPLSPTSFASTIAPPLSYSGNLWAWTPQIRVEHRFKTADKGTFVVQGGILDPLSGEELENSTYLTPGAGQRSGVPAIASHIGWQRGADSSLSFGVGGYYTRQDWRFGRRVDGWAATGDWDLPLGSRFGLSGEFYRGRAIGGLGAGQNGSVLFSGNPDDPAAAVRGLNETGGWIQLKYKALERVEFNTAFGQDVPFVADLRKSPYNLNYPIPPIGRNSSGFINMIFQVRSNLFFSTEYRKIWTHQLNTARPDADHINFGAGIVF
jgi:hypothetical protein